MNRSIEPRASSLRTCSGRSCGGVEKHRVCARRHGCPKADSAAVGSLASRRRRQPLSLVLCSVRHHLLVPLLEERRPALAASLALGCSIALTLPVRLSFLMEVEPGRRPAPGRYPPLQPFVPTMPTRSFCSRLCGCPLSRDREFGGNLPTKTHTVPTGTGD